MTNMIALAGASAQAAPRWTAAASQPRPGHHRDRAEPGANPGGVPVVPVPVCQGWQAALSLIAGWASAPDVPPIHLSWPSREG
jgi:hypothetical protein